MDARRHRLPLPAFATALVASLALAAPAAHAAACPGADQLPLLSSLASARTATLCLLNQERAASHLAPLTSQPTLEAAATTYAQSMVTQGFFAHVSPSGQTITERLASYISGTRSYLVGENLAWGQSVLGTPVSTVNAWMRSEGHRENILNANFEEIGIGVVPGSPKGGLLDLGATYATEFGFRELAGGKAGTQASAAAQADDAAPAAGTKAKPLPAKTKRRISRQCRTIARRAKGSAKTRRARYDRCVRTRTQAARKAAR